MSSPGKRSWRLLPLLAALTAGCDLPGRPDPADRPVPADQVKDFGALYATHCAGCHGADGKLGPAPPLNDARRTSRLLPLDSYHATYGAPPMLAITGKPASSAEETLSAPPTACQEIPLNALTRIR